MPFNSQTLEELTFRGEPEWLRDRRRTAFEAYERLPMPSRTDEEWRRTDVTQFNPATYAEFESPNGRGPTGLLKDVAGSIRHDGRVYMSINSRQMESVVLEPLAIAARDHRALLDSRLFSLARSDRDHFAALHSAFFTGGTFLYVPDGVVIDQPIVSQHFSHKGGTSVLPHTVIVAGRGARFNFLDEYIGEEDEEAAYRSGSAEIFVDEGADVGYVSIQKWGRKAWHLADQRARLEKDSRLRLFNVTLGGQFSKTRVEASLMGPGGSAELKGIYLASGKQFFDFHTLQDHQVGNTTSDLLFKGALQDTARAVYAGLIRIEKGAARSDAYQANRNLVLSEHAKATSIPMLEIDNNDVRCTHGATVGPVDPMSMFYLQSRGIPATTAKRMIVQGFFGEVLERIPFEQARQLVETELEARLG